MITNRGIFARKANPFWTVYQIALLQNRARIENTDSISGAQNEPILNVYRDLEQFSHVFRNREKKHIKTNQFWTFY